MLFIHGCLVCERMQHPHTCEWAFSSEMCMHSHIQSGDLAQEAQSILVTNQQWGMGGDH